jgi:plasmid stability protein
MNSRSACVRPLPGISGRWNAELREIVRQALNGPQRGSAADFQELAAEIRALSHGRRQTPSEDLLRESRDER